MIVGLLSDTHGHFGPAKTGVELLLAGGAQVLVHCGDVGGALIVDLLAGTRSYFVFGNNDWDREELATYARQVGVTCLGVSGEILLDGEPAMVLHGDDPAAKARVLRERRHRYLFHGHTHVRADQTIGGVRVINPGALHRAPIKTVALLDTTSGVLTSLDIATAARAGDDATR